MRSTRTYIPTRSRTHAHTHAYATRGRKNSIIFLSGKKKKKSSPRDFTYYLYTHTHTHTIQLVTRVLSVRPNPSERVSTYVYRRETFVDNNNNNNNRIVAWCGGCRLRSPSGRVTIVPGWVTVYVVNPRHIHTCSDQRPMTIGGTR